MAALESKGQKADDTANVKRAPKIEKNHRVGRIIEKHSLTLAISIEVCASLFTTYCWSARDLG